MEEAIFHISEIPFPLICKHTGIYHCVKNAKEQGSKNRRAKLQVLVVVSIWGVICFLAPQRWAEWYFTPHLVFVVSPRRDDLYYRGWEIKEGFLTDLMKHASYKPWEIVSIVQLPCCSAKCNHEAKLVETVAFVATQATGFMMLQFDVEDCNHSFLGVMHTLLLSTEFIRISYVYS